MKLEFHPEAELELIEAAAYYELQIAGLGERFEAEVRRATDLVLEHPEIGAPANPVLRKLVLNRFPFSLFYSVTSDVLRIEVVAEQSPPLWGCGGEATLPRSGLLEQRVVADRLRPCKIGAIRSSGSLWPSIACTIYQGRKSMSMG